MDERRGRPCPRCGAQSLGALDVNHPPGTCEEPYNPVKDVVRKTLLEHIPSLSDEDEAAIYERMGLEDDVADLALRTCMCGKRIDGYYQYVDHLIEVFGGESGYGG